MKLARERCNEGLTTVIDAMNLRDSDRKKFIELWKWERAYTIVFDSEKWIEQNRIRKEKKIKWYIPERIVEKKILSFNTSTSIKWNNIVIADEIEAMQEIYENLLLTEENNILVYGDIHGMKDFYKHYKTLQVKYTKDENVPLSLFVWDIVDRWDYSVDNLCFIISEVKKWNVEMIMGNHEFKFLRNIKNFLKNGVIEDFIEANYKTIKQFIELHKKDGIYEWFIEEIKWENFNLHRVKNFLESLSYYKIISTDTVKKYCVTHGPVLIPEDFGNLKKSQCIFWSEQLTENLRVSKEQCRENNENFIQAAHELYRKNAINCVNGHVDMQEFIDELNVDWFYSLEWKVDSWGQMKVLVLSKNWDEISESIESFYSNLNYTRWQADTWEYAWFSNMDNKLMYRRDYGDLVIFKYTRKVFYKNLWLKNSDEDNIRLIRARGIVFDRLGNVISYPFDKVFNNGETLTDVNGKIVKDHKLAEWEYQFIEKLSGFLWVISQDFYNRNKLLIHTSGSLDSLFNKYIEDFLSDEQKLNVVEFFKTKGKHTLMFEVIHPSDPHIIKYWDSDYGLYLIWARRLEAESLESMQLFSEADLDSLWEELWFRRPKHFIESYHDFKKRIMEEKIEWYMVRDKDSWEFLIKIKFPYYLVTKFLARMWVENFKFLLANKEKFVESKNIDEEFFPVVNYIHENKEIFMSLEEQWKVEKIRQFIENNI